MKVIQTDNFAREYIPDKLIKENLSKEEAEKLAAELNKGCSNYSLHYHLVVEDNYKLNEGPL